MLLLPTNITIVIIVEILTPNKLISSAFIHVFPRFYLHSLYEYFLSFLLKVDSVHLNLEEAIHTSFDAKK